MRGKISHRLISLSGQPSCVAGSDNNKAKKQATSKCSETSTITKPTSASCCSSRSNPRPHDQRHIRCCFGAVILAAREGSRKIVHEHQEGAVHRVEELQPPLVSLHTILHPGQTYIVKGQSSSTYCAGNLPCQSLYAES